MALETQPKAEKPRSAQDDSSPQLEIQTVTLALGSGTTLTFKGDPQRWVSGMTGFSLSFKKCEGHNVQEISTAITTSKPGSCQIQVSVSGKLTDNSGNSADPSLSWITVAVVAETVSDAENYTLANNQSISSGSSNDPVVSISNAPPVIAAEAFLSGFDLSYGSGKTHHNVEEVNASAAYNLSSDQESATISGTAAMYDHSGHQASASIDTGFIANTASGSSLLLAISSKQQSTGEQSVDFSNQLSPGQTLGSQAAVFISGFQVSYDSKQDHQVNTIAGGLIKGVDQKESTVPTDEGFTWLKYQTSASVPSVSGTKVTFQGPQTIMCDLGHPVNHSQDNSNSWVDLVVVAVSITPAST